MRVFRFCLLALVLGPTVSASEPFALVQPGMPGSPRQAEGFLETFAAYLKASTGDEYQGSYDNLPSRALKSLARIPWALRALRALRGPTTAPRGTPSEV